MPTQTFTGTLAVQDCCNCGMTFGVPADFNARRLEDHKDFYCPAGHSQHYIGKTEAQKERERADAAERQLQYARSSAQAARDQRDQAYRSAAAYKGHATRIRNLIAQGVCPVPGCRRNFTNVRAHLANQHPDWHKHEEA